MKLPYRLLFSAICTFLLLGCNEKEKSKNNQKDSSTASIAQSTGKIDTTVVKDMPEGVNVPTGMVWVPGGVFTKGAVASDQIAMSHERPAHKVAVDGFFIDVTEVTNGQFKKFVEETGYVTVAEREIDWEEIKIRKQ